jgi:hypothetical protein
MALSGRIAPPEVGTALALPADDNQGTRDDDRPAMGADELIRRLLEADMITAQGGLRFHDTSTNVSVNPGCCFGLEDWRAWLDVVHSVQEGLKGLSLPRRTVGCSPCADSRGGAGCAARRGPGHQRTAGRWFYSPEVACAAVHRPATAPDVHRRRMSHATDPVVPF